MKERGRTRGATLSWDESIGIVLAAGSRSRSRTTVLPTPRSINDIRLPVRPFKVRSSENRDGVYRHRSPALARGKRIPENFYRDRRWSFAITSAPGSGIFFEIAKPYLSLTRDARHGTFQSVIFLSTKYRARLFPGSCINGSDWESLDFAIDRY